ncbi:tyrosine-type recombinase/integrase [Shouchella sp. 1P09AA]|uniref:tyrosine-type recombinase/integrase n=1 Tax=unclassified Shouchella TaxID=2893065 RepID=UPI0039A00C78
MDIKSHSLLPRLGDQLNLMITEANKGPLVRMLLNGEQFDQLERMVFEQEQSTLHGFEQFSDLELIYYYVHKPTYDDNAKNRKAQTKKEYLRDLLQFLSFFQYSAQAEQRDSSSLIRSLKKVHIRQYQQWLKEVVRIDGKMGYPASTRTRKNAVVKGFLNWLYDEDVTEQPLHVAFRKSTTRRDEKPDRYLSVGEVQSLLQYYKDHPINHAILILLITTGLRIDEIASATWGDVYQDSSVRQNAYYLKVIGKGNVVRHARLMDPVMDSIRRFRKRRNLTCELDPLNTEPLLCSNTGRFYSYKYLSNVVIHLIKKTGFKWVTQKEGNISPHWFRHFFVNYSVVELQLPIQQVQRTVGHASSQTTEGYVSQYMLKKNDASLHWDERLFQ